MSNDQLRAQSFLHRLTGATEAKAKETPKLMTKKPKAKEPAKINRGRERRSLVDQTGRTVGPQHGDTDS